MNRSNTFQGPNDSRTSGSTCTTTKLSPSVEPLAQTHWAGPRFPAKYVLSTSKTRHVYTADPKQKTQNSELTQNLLHRSRWTCPRPVGSSCPPQTALWAASLLWTLKVDLCIVLLRAVRRSRTPWPSKTPCFSFFFSSIRTYIQKLNLFFVIFFFTFLCCLCCSIDMIFDYCKIDDVPKPTETS